MPEEFDVYSLVYKLKSSGQTLGDYLGARIHSGIKTGLNKAFVIDTPTRERLVAADPNSVEIIKPWLRGRDIKRWKVEWAGFWVIAIETSRTREWPWSQRGRTLESEAVFARTYPAIYEHLLPFKDRAVRRHHQGRHWWELQSCSYYEAFEAPKIIWPGTATKPKFAFDDQGYFYGNTGYFIPLLGDGEAAFLLSVLNSSVMHWHHNYVTGQVRGGFGRYQAQHVLQMPLPERRPDGAQEIDTVIDAITAAAGADIGFGVDANASETPQEFVNELAYWMYDLDPDEIEIIERATSLREEVEAFTFTHKISFPNLEFTEVDFAACCKSFSEAFASRMNDRVVEVLFDLEDATRMDDLWGIQQVNIRFDEKCWDIIIELLASAGSFLRGAGRTLEALNQRNKITEDRMRQTTLDAAKKGITEVIDKHLADKPSDTATHTQDNGEFRTHAKDNDARATLTKPEDIQQVQSPNCNIELHVIVPADSVPGSFTITFHTNKEE